MTRNFSQPIDFDDLCADDRWLRRLARLIVGDGADADDLVQDAWNVALRQPESVARTRSWMAGILRRLAMHRSRSILRRRRHMAQLSATSAVAPAADNQADLAEARRALIDAIERLGEPGRGLVLRRFFAGESIESIARERGQDAAVARSQLARAIGQLRQYLGTKDRSFLAPLVVAMPVAAHRASIATATRVGGIIVSKKSAAIAAAVVGILSFAVFEFMSGQSGTDDRMTAEIPTSNAHAEQPRRRSATESSAQLPPAETAEGAATQPFATTPASTLVGTIGGRVVDESGHPVAGASLRKVRAFVEAPTDLADSAQPPQARSDADGRFSIDLEPHEAIVVVIASASGYSAAESKPLPSGSFVELRLRRTASLYGRVTDEHGSPVAGADIRFRTSSWNTTISGGQTSAADGSFEFGDLTLPPGNGNRGASLRVIADGFAPYQEYLCAADLRQRTSAAAPKVIRLSRGRHLEVLVIDDDTEAACPDAAVLLWVRDQSIPASSSPWRAGIAHAPIRTLRTDGTGRLVIDHIDWSSESESPLGITVTKDSYAAVWRRIVAGFVDPKIVVRLSRSATVRGRVVDLLGRPVAHACVTITHPDDDHSFFAEPRFQDFGIGDVAWTDALGYFSSSAAPASAKEERSVYVQAAGRGLYSERKLVTVRAAGTTNSGELRLAFSEPPTQASTDVGRMLRGIVVDRRGRPIPGATVASQSRQTPNRAHTSFDGTFALRVPSASESAHDRAVLIRHPRFAATVRELPADLGGDPTQFVLDDAAKLSGIARHVDGRPVSGLTLRICDTSWTPAATDDGPPANVIENITTDADGRFGLADAPSGPIEISYRRDRQASPIRLTGLRASDGEITITVPSDGASR